MSRINVDTEKLSIQIDKLKAIEMKLNEILSIIKKDNVILKEVWETKTSEEVFENFDTYYSYIEESINNIGNDIKFLEKVVNAQYIENETNINAEIDTKVAM